MTDLAYAWEKYSTAIHSLTGEGSLQDRLHGAFTSFHALRPQDFNDPELREQCQKIWDRLTVVKSDPIKGHVPATLEQMSDGEARQVRDLILDMTFMIARARLDEARNRSK